MRRWQLFGMLGTALGVWCGCGDSSGSLTVEQQGGSGPELSTGGSAAAGRSEGETAALGGGETQPTAAEQQAGEGGTAATAGTTAMAKPEPSASASEPSASEPSASEPAEVTVEPSAEPPQSAANFDPNAPENIVPGSGPLGVETSCDGVDDDLNGVIDDVDVTGDGICDCLRIGVLGLHGEWGGGDVVDGWFDEKLENSVEDLGDATLSSGVLAPYQILIIRDVSSAHTPGLSFSAAEAEALWEWVREGGGLMTLIGYSDPTEVVNVNKLLSPFGLAYGSEQIVPGEGAAVGVGTWLEHPLSVGIEQIGADNGYPVEGQGTTFATQDGYDFGKAVTIGDGHVLVWGDEWVTYLDEWSGSAEYQVDEFWTNALRWLPRLNECQVPARP